MRLAVESLVYNDKLRNNTDFNAITIGLEVVYLGNKNKIGTLKNGNLRECEPWRMGTKMETRMGPVRRPKIKGARIGWKSQNWLEELELAGRIRTG